MAYILTDSTADIYSSEEETILIVHIQSYYSISYYTIQLHVIYYKMWVQSWLGQHSLGNIL